MKVANLTLVLAAGILIGFGAFGCGDDDESTFSGTGGSATGGTGGSATGGTAGSVMGGTGGGDTGGTGGGDTGGTGGGDTGGTGGSDTGGTGGSATGGTGGSDTGGTGGSATGGTGGSATGGTGGSATGGTGGSATGGTGGSATGGTGGGTGGTGGISVTCTLTTSDADCDVCFQALCTSECFAFESEPTTWDWLACYQGCSTTACYEGCDTQYPQAESTGAAFFGCMEAQCDTECGSGTSCGLTVQNPICDACFDSKCNAECLAFAADPNWQAWLQCYSGCSTDACYTACDQQYPTAASTGEVFFGCMETECATECYGGGTDCGLSTGDPVCDTCFDTQCNAECKAFAADPNWQAWLQCYNGCTDDACLTACDQQYPTAASTGEVFFDCMELNCSVECG